MPSTSTGASLLAADKASSIMFGRSFLDRQQLTHDPLESTTIFSTALNGSTFLQDELMQTTEQHMMAADQLVASTESPVTILRSFEELGHWTADTKITALIHALLASFSVILVSELGDKTFIITAIMAMKNSRSLVFISSASALLIMTILSVGMGVAVTVIPELYTHYASIVLFLCFGLKMLKESWDMTNNHDEESEFEEVKRSLEVDETAADKMGKTKDTPGQPIELVTEEPHEVDKQRQEAGKRKMFAQQAKKWYSKFVETLSIAPIIIKVFTMVFVAEWGDRSQISTVILAAREDSAGVFIGSLSGHVFCTGLAVIGGRFVADVISVRTMTILGGIIFLFFAVFAILTGPGVS